MTRGPLFHTSERWPQLLPRCGDPFPESPPLSPVGRLQVSLALVVCSFPVCKHHIMVIVHSCLPRCPEVRDLSWLWNLEAIVETGKMSTIMLLFEVCAGAAWQQLGDFDKSETTITCGEVLPPFPVVAVLLSSENSERPKASWKQIPKLGSFHDHSAWWDYQ